MAFVRCRPIGPPPKPPSPRSMLDVAPPVIACSSSQFREPNSRSSARSPSMRSTRAATTSIVGEPPDLIRNPLPQNVVRGGQERLRVTPALRWVVPHGPDSHVVGFPLVARENVRMDVGVFVAQHFKIHSTKSSILSSARTFHCHREQIHVGEELDPVSAFELGQRGCRGIFVEQETVARKKLRVADHRVPRIKLAQDSRILTSLRRPYPIASPIHAMGCTSRDRH